MFALLRRGWLTYFGIQISCGITCKLIANTRSVCITVERLTYILWHTKFVWNIVQTYSKHTKCLYYCGEADLHTLAYKSRVEYRANLLQTHEVFVLLWRGWLTYFGIQISCGISCKLIANIRSVCITAERLTYILWHTNLVWNNVQTYCKHTKCLYYCGEADLHTLAYKSRVEYRANIANIRSVCITVERLTYILWHTNLVWNIVQTYCKHTKCLYYCGEADLHTLAHKIRVEYRANLLQTHEVFVLLWRGSLTYSGTQISCGISCKLRFFFFFFFFGGGAFLLLLFFSSFDIS